jgi:hypothetical protein
MNPIRIPNIDNYHIEISNNTLILTPKMPEQLKHLPQNGLNLTEKEMVKLIRGSKILSCLIMNDDKIISQKLKYRGILIELWKAIDREVILKNTTFKIKSTDEKNINGYNYIPDLKFSFQNKDSPGILEEIIHMVKLNKFKMNIEIQLENGNVINYDSF